jgi:hypothetical protein
MTRNAQTYGKICGSMFGEVGVKVFVGVNIVGEGVEEGARVGVGVVVGVGEAVLQLIIIQTIIAYVWIVQGESKAREVDPPTSPESTV